MHRFDVNLMKQNSTKCHVYKKEFCKLVNLKYLKLTSFIHTDDRYV